MMSYTTIIVLIGTAIIGGLAGAVGCFAVLRRQALLGDAISHAALPGIVLAFLILGVKDHAGLMIGATLSGVLGIVWIRGITTNTRLKTDTALGLILSLFFGVGVLLLTYTQGLDNANQAGLDKYLYGQAATLLLEDIWVAIIASVLIFGFIVFYWSSIKLVLFDRSYAQSRGYKLRNWDLFINGLIVVAIVLGLQTVGVVLMSALLLAPAAAARQLTDRLIMMVIGAGLIGALAGMLGTMISSGLLFNLGNVSVPTGPAVVLVAMVLVLLCFVFAPKRGLLARELRFRESRSNLILNNTLAFMYNIVNEHEDYQRPHAVKLLNNFKGYNKRSLGQLVSKGYIQLHQNYWVLTEQGYSTARDLYNKEVHTQE